MTKPDVEKKGAVLSLNDILAGKERVQANIPLAAVSTNNPIVDRSILANKIASGPPYPPIHVRKTITDQGVTYDVIRGLHSAVAAKQNSTEEITAYVYTSETISDNELLNLRLKATAEGPHTLRFARFITYLMEGFAETSFASKGLSIVKAFKILDAKQKLSPLLNKKELQELGVWFFEKSEASGLAISSLYHNIRSASKADPELVRDVRGIDPGMRPQPGDMTPAQLQVIVSLFPDNYKRQRELLAETAEKGMSSSEILRHLSPTNRAVEQTEAEARVRVLTTQIGNLKRENIILTNELTEAKKIISRLQRQLDKNPIPTGKAANPQKETPLKPMNINPRQIFAVDWKQRGNCNQNPESMYVSGAKQNDAKKVCDGCPVLIVCLATAYKTEVEDIDSALGVWGGMTQRERRAAIKTKSQDVRKFVAEVEHKMGRPL